MPSWSGSVPASATPPSLGAGGWQVPTAPGRCFFGVGGDAVWALPDAPGTAPAAELALAELLLQQKRVAEAVAQLEHLILTYPGSALVPQARQRLDEARGAVPRT